MKYTELVRGVNLYNTKEVDKTHSFPPKPYDIPIGDKAYKDAIFSHNHLEDRIIPFLKRWNIRVGVDKQKLKNAIKSVPKKYKEKLGIVEINLRSHGEREEIKKIYDNFTRIGKNRKTYTGAAKSLHILNPNLFIMWDVGIRESCGCNGTSEGYVNFLLRSQMEVFEIKDSYEKVSRSIDPLSDLLGKLYTQRLSILKALDEYNWEKYRRGRL